MMAERSAALLLCGTTVSTWSAFRLCKQAAEEQKPIAILNLGPCRADSLVPLSPESVKIEQSLVDVFHEMKENVQ